MSLGFTWSANMKHSPSVERGSNEAYYLYDFGLNRAVLFIYRGVRPTDWYIWFSLWEDYLMEGVKTLEEAKATALAIWRMR